MARIRDFETRASIFTFVNLDHSFFMTKLKQRAKWIAFVSKYTNIT